MFMLNVDENSNACDLDLVRSVGQYFRLSKPKQDAVFNEVFKAVKLWEKIARAAGLQPNEIERFRTAFQRERLLQIPGD